MAQERELATRLLATRVADSLVTLTWPGIPKASRSFFNLASGEAANFQYFNTIFVFLAVNLADFPRESIRETETIGADLKTGSMLLVHLVEIELSLHNLSECAPVSQARWDRV